MTDVARRFILHADLDAFYASVEQQDNPALRGKPVVVGGPPESRGVVAAASYEARQYGIRSAMPMRTALNKCPDLVRVSPRFDRYREVSRQIMEMFRSLTPLVEPLSLDEAYLDISEQFPVEKVEEVGRGLKATVRQDTGLAITIGGGTSKTVAKIASQVAKPDGLLLVGPGEECSFLAPLDVGILSGVGPKSGAVLSEHGVKTLGDLAACEEAWLRRAFGKRGPELKQRASGTDHHPVTPHREAKSISAEVTMPRDVDDAAVLREQIEELSRHVAVRLEREGLVGRTIFVKLRLADFSTFTRQATLPVPTNEVETVIRVANELLRRELRPGQKFRLIGVGVTGFRGLSQLAMDMLA